MSQWHVRVAVPLLAAASLAAFGCASPPDAEKKAAGDAVSAAKSAGAERYALTEFTAMTAALRKAEAEMTAQSYKEAKASYVRAKDLADRATRSAETGRVAAKADADKQVADVESRWNDLRARGDAGAKTLKAEQKALWNANARTVAVHLESAKTALAGDASAATAKLAPIRAELDKLEANLVAMATPASKPPTKKK
jgi:hypothetical protein